jgi:UDP-GlcNAc:undecaprenyl-phosphate GlcNAc-1-phosphate transferase
MGDAGSTFLGFFLAARSLQAELGADSVMQTWAIRLAVLAVPWYDLASVVILRLWQGRSPFHADQQHLSHRLVAMGLSKPAAVGTIYLLALANGLVGLALLDSGPTVIVLLITQLALWWTALAAVEYFPHFHKLPLVPSPSPVDRHMRS